ncbi:hypothetical protein NDU88_003350 [Pleurodeles waltl]|uniref:Uncharacterized protein n=1 Tax=Pleurodeles waltl TaxID=8319 RepID=A0AAV7Q963_PLEWA|nr:hypothetical protein NDU88_003350 [Pleurodeles waltl]
MDRWALIIDSGLPRLFLRSLEDQTLTLPGSTHSYYLPTHRLRSHFPWPDGPRGAWPCHETRWPPRAQALCRSDSGGVAGVWRQPENPPYLALLTPITAVPLTCAWGLRRCESGGQTLATRSRQRGPGQRGGVASPEGRGWCSRSGCEAAWRATRTVKTRDCFIRFLDPWRGDLLKHRGLSYPPMTEEGRDFIREAGLRLLNTRRRSLSEALHHKRLTPTTTSPHTSPPPTEPTTMSDKDHSTTMDRILQEITTVSRRIEGMDASITSLTLETKSMQSDIAGFQSRVMGLEQRMGSLETQATVSQDRDQDLLYLRSKLTDMDDRSRRDNIRLLGIPENEEGTDMQALLSSTLPKLTSLDFDPPLEFQRAHRIGPKRSNNSSSPDQSSHAFLPHNQTRQILQAACNHGPFRIDQHDIRITADYSKETNERRKAFLALRPRLRQLEMKYGLFDPARMWVTKNGVSKDF